MTKYRSQQTAYAVRYNKFYRAGYRRTVPSLGSMRRIQALHAIGYTRKMLAEILDLRADSLADLVRGRRMVRIDAETARKIAEGYRTLSVQPLHNSRAKTWARKAGYAPPMAWNDIDDPTERPRGIKWITSCQVRVASSRTHPDGRPCGESRRLRRGKCDKHYRQELQEEKRAA